MCFCREIGVDRRFARDRRGQILDVASGGVHDSSIRFAHAHVIHVELFIRRSCNRRTSWPKRSTPASLWIFARRVSFALSGAVALEAIGRLQLFDDDRFLRIVGFLFGRFGLIGPELLVCLYWSGRWFRLRMKVLIERRRSGPCGGKAFVNLLKREDRAGKSVYKEGMRRVNKEEPVRVAVANHSDTDQSGLSRLIDSLDCAFCAEVLSRS